MLWDITFSRSTRKTFHKSASTSRLSIMVVLTWKTGPKRPSPTFCLKSKSLVAWAIVSYVMTFACWSGPPKTSVGLTTQPIPCQSQSQYIKKIRKESNSDPPCNSSVIGRGFITWYARFAEWYRFSLGSLISFNLITAPTAAGGDHKHYYTKYSKDDVQPQEISSSICHNISPSIVNQRNEEFTDHQTNNILGFVLLDRNDE